MQNITPQDWLGLAVNNLHESRHHSAQRLAIFLEMEIWRFGNTGVDGTSLLARFDSGLSTFKEEDKLFSDLNYFSHTGWLTQLDDQLYLSVPQERTLPVMPGFHPGSRSRSHIEKNIRNRVHQRDGWVCHICGMETSEADPGMRLSIDWSAVLDHIKPHAHGGSDRPSNLATAHYWCNTVRGDRAIPNRIIQKVRVILKLSTQGAISNAEELVCDPLLIPDWMHGAYRSDDDIRCTWA